MTTLCARVSVLSASLALLAASVHAQVGGTVPTDGEVRFDRSPETLLVSYLEIAGEWAEQDLTPLVRIYGDGTVRVHRPQGIEGAGSYLAKLGAAELHRLLVAIVDAVDGFDTNAVEASKQQAEQARVAASLAAGAAPVFHGVSDDSISVFELHLLGYRAAGEAFFAGEIDRQLSWLGLETDAGRFPGVEAIRNLRSVELELRALWNRNDLVRTGQ